MEEESIQRATSSVRAVSQPSPSRVLKQPERSPMSETTGTQRKYRRVKREKKLDDFPIETFDVPGVSRLVITPKHQLIIKCVVGDDVTSENPWKYVPKYILEDNGALQEEDSSFLPIRQDIINYTGEEFLLGYIPDEARDYDEFYFCLTESAEKLVTEIIERNRIKQEERLNNSVVKKVKRWRSMGSEEEVNDLQLKNNRLLLGVEVEAECPIITAECMFRLKLAEYENSTYTEVLPGRRIYSNVLRHKIDAGTQVTPFVKSSEAQTVYSYPINACTQYEYQYEPIQSLSTDFVESIQSFAKKELEELFNKICVNNNINFYDNDYLNLVQNEKFTREPTISTIKEYTSMIETNLCHGKQISCVSFHPMWTGTLAVSYSDEAGSKYMKYQPNKDIVNEATYNVTHVLLWSFKDNLNPRLILETPREVNMVSFCPHNENILVGGCVNGQIVIWDIKNKIEAVEQEELLSSSQQSYRTLMYNLTKWMKNTKNVRRVPVTAVSELEYSHRSCVTEIRWFSPFREMSRSGMISEIPEEEDRISIQFMTSARDGVVLTWDLQAKPLMSSSTYKPPRRSKRLKKRPSALNIDISPYRILHRVLKPVFKINIVDPYLNRNLSLASLSIRFSVAQYVERYPDPKRKFNITDRILFDYVYKRPTHPLFTGLITGTTEGDFVVATWDGFNFNAGEVVNKENAKVINCAKYHDGPVVSLARSELFPDLCLTVGGKVFALWKITFFGKPILWRRSKYKYTHGAWNTYRPSIFRLARSDGCFERWHLKTRSDRYQTLGFSPGKGLTGTYSHPRPMKQHVLAVADTSGMIRLFAVAHNLTQATEEDKWSTYRICEREVDRKRKFMKWQEEWLTKNAEYVRDKRETELQKQLAREEEIRKQRRRLLDEIEELEKQAATQMDLINKPEPGHYVEWAQQQWKIKEKERMNKVLLNKKALNIGVLEKQQMPLKKLNEENERKSRKQQQRLNNSTKIFENTVTTLFPEAMAKQLPPPLDPYAGGEPLEVRETYFRNYNDIEDASQKYVDKHRYLYHFDWLHVIKSGKERRRLLDGFYQRNSHRNRIINEKQKRGEDVKLPLWKLQSERESIDGSVSSNEASVESLTGDAVIE